MEERNKTIHSGLVETSQAQWMASTQSGGCSQGKWRHTTRTRRDSSNNKRAALGGLGCDDGVDL